MIANTIDTSVKDLCSTGKSEKYFILLAISNTTLPLSPDKQFWKQEGK